MSREFKPGDVAMAVRANDDGEFLVVRTRGDGDYWSAPRGWPASVSADAIREYRPLVVIDPEYREQVERLRSLLFGNSAHAHGITEMQAALREFADPKPPKPDEPTGLGGVVEDAEGLKWVRFADSEPNEKNWATGDAAFNRAYADIDAVRVLSDGVRP